MNGSCLYLHGLFISKNFLGGIFVKTFYLAASTWDIMRENLKSLLKKDGGKIMIIIIITAIASLMTLDYIDTKEAEKSAKLYEIIEYIEDDDEK